MEIKELQKAITTLSDPDKNAIFHYVSSILQETSATSLFEEALETKFSNGLYCPHCKHYHIRKNGHNKSGKQRYLCMFCHHSFSETTNTFLNGTKLPLSTWMKYLECFCRDVSLRECAEYVGVCLKTSFFMRHKILDCLYLNHNIEMVVGIVELDEAHTHVSYCGNHKKQDNSVQLPRKAYKRSRKGKKCYSINKAKENVIIATAIDRNGQIYSKIAKTGTTTLDEKSMEKTYGKMIEEESKLCSDGLFVYRKFAEKHKLELHAFKKESKEKRGLYHINHINNYHAKIKRYQSRHVGISTKYLDDYLAYLSWEVKNIKATIQEKVQNLMLVIFATTTQLRQSDLIKTGYFY